MIETLQHDYCSDCLPKENGVTHLSPSPIINQLRTFAEYDGELKRVIQDLKFNKNPRAALTIAQLIEEDFIRFYEKISHKKQVTLLPIPTDRISYATRGFHPLLEILSQIKRRNRSLPITTDLLKKSSFHFSQNELNRQERLKNLKDSFTIKYAPPAHILLFDDVYTTGTTLNRVAEKLKEYGAKSLYGYVIARVN